jgi:hypothetical protein
MRKSIIAIVTIVEGVKKFVQTIDRRQADKKYAVTLTTEPEQAYDFDTKALAEEIIPSIVNPFERKYVSQNVIVVASAYDKQLDARMN